MLLCRKGDLTSHAGRIFGPPTSNEVLPVVVTAVLATIGWACYSILSFAGRVFWGAGHHFTFLARDKEGASRLRIHLWAYRDMEQRYASRGESMRVARGPGRAPHAP